MSFSRPMRIALPETRTGTGNLDIPKSLGPLEVAARRGNAILVRMLLDKGADIDFMYAVYRDNENHSGCAYTALQIAAFWGHLPVVELLLDSGANINDVRQTLGTPLQAALEGGHLDVADMLLSRGADIDRHWEMFGSCLQVYSERGHLEVVQFLLDRGANIEDPGGENGNALQVACDAGHIDIVRFLLGKRVDARAPGKKLGNALQAASAKGHLDIVKLLLHQGVRVDDTDRYTKTALCLAAGNGHNQTVIFLLRKGANVDGITTLLKKPEPPGESLQGKIQHEILWLRRPWENQDSVATPLHLAAVSGHESTVSILLQNGANPHLEGKLRHNRTDSSDEYNFNKFSSTPLFAASFWGYASTAKRLFQHDPWGYISHNTFTPTMEASLARNKKAITAMLVHEAFLAGFKAEHFDSAFRYACAEGYTEFSKQILEYFVLENWPTALLLAAERGRSSVVEVLLQNGADVEIRDEHGYLALDLAIKGIEKHRYHCWPLDTPNWIEVLRLLLCAGADTNDLSGKIREVLPDIAKRGGVDILRELDRRGYNTLDDAALYSYALIEASANGYVEKIYYMNTKHVPSTRNIKAAVLAAIKRHGQSSDRIPTIKALLSLKAPLFFDESEDVEPLTISSEKQYPDIVAILLQHIRHSRSILEAALKSAIHYGCVASVRLILESQSWESAVYLELCSRFISECLSFQSQGSMDMLTYLFEQGVSPNTRDPKTGATLLYIAATRRNGETVRSLMTHGAEVDLEGGEYGTALHGAAAAGNTEVVESLLLSGADVNAQNERIGTPLMAVMGQMWRYCSFDVFGIRCPFECHCCCAKVLLYWDADVDAKGGNFGTALHAAQKVGNKLGIKLLLQGNESDDDNDRGQSRESRSVLEERETWKRRLRPRNLGKRQANNHD